MHSFVKINDTQWVHTSRVRAFDTDQDGYLTRVWLDDEEGSRSVTRRYRVLDGVLVGPSSEWPFLLSTDAAAEVRQ
jgi:hypothetical protein